MTTFKRERRYLVLKITDVALLSVEQQQALDDLCAAVRAIRAKRKRPALQCVVVEHDWPEYNLVWTLIEERMKRETKP